MIAQKVKKVIGIEYSEDLVHRARQNSSINNIIHIPTINIVEYDSETHNRFNKHHHKHSVYQIIKVKYFVQQLIYYIFDLINEIEFFMNRIPSPDSNEIQEFYQYLSQLHPSLHIIFDNIVNEPNPTNNI